MAAGTRNVGISGTVTFSTKNVSATVQVHERYKGTGEWTAKSGEGYVFVAATTEHEQAPQTENLDLGEIELDDDNLVYQYRITISSNQVNPLFYDFAEVAASGNGFTVTGQTSTGNIASSSESDVEIIVTVTITDPAQIASAWELDLVGSLYLGNSAADITALKG